MICAECGGEIGRETYQCPKFRSKIVCADCCKTCEYRGDAIYGSHCLYAGRHENYIEKCDLTMWRLAYLAKTYAERARYLYKRNWPREAELAERQVAKFSQLFYKMQMDKKELPEITPEALFNKYSPYCAERHPHIDYNTNWRRYQ